MKKAVKKISDFFKKIYHNRKKYYLNIKSFCLKYKYIFFMALPFIAIDLITRILGNSIGFYGIYHLVPNLFTIIWTMLFIGISLSFKSKIGKAIYLFFNIVFVVVFLVNNVYYSTTSTFFDFSLIESASEGAPYIWDTIKNTNIWVYISLLLIILLIIWGFKNIPKQDKNKPQLLIKIILYFSVLHIITPVFLGKADKDLTWSTWRNPKNIYLSFNDNNKSLRISGIYEYTIRNFYITFMKTEQVINQEDMTYLDNAFKEETNTKNKYTGIFKDKNIIFLQLEGIDSWLLTKDDTPTLYNMQKNAYNFKNHFSYYNGGGSTFNSEFAVNTGFITPLSYTQNAYSFNKNSYPYSMAHIFKDLGYAVNAFHMNTGEYYSRFTNYANWGYDNYYGLIDMKNYKDDSYKLDREMILNTDFSDLMFPEDTKFVDYLITYSTHMPFNNTNKSSVCKLLYDLDNQTTEPNKDKEPVIMTEEECARRQAKETDYMVELLLQKLKEKGLYDSTVIIVFTDHYLYTIEDKTILDNYKETNNNLINKTPFFIWSSNTKETNIKSVTSQLNILPTTLNLFGINYNPNDYIGEDALASNYSGIVFFSDYSWYDGNVYVDGGIVTNGKKISEAKLEEKNYYVSYITKKNDLALRYDYFKNKQSNKKDLS